MGAHALAGRDKLTLVTSPGIGSFGLWAEQLVAESTGKEGAGIVPVAGEPLRPPGFYGADRLFVYLRLEGDANGETDEFVDAVASAGHPVVRDRSGRCVRHRGRALPVAVRHGGSRRPSWGSTRSTSPTCGWPRSAPKTC